MEINHPTYGQGVEPSVQPQLEHQNTNTNEQNSMESLLGQEGLGIEFPQAGEIRQGVIATIKENEILVSIGTKSEGVISGKELDSIPKEEKDALQVGSEIPVYVVNPEDENGNVVLSYMRAIEQQDWQYVTDL
ncbi:MAG: S1 RNA-binding domain-containing protein, partial [Anaerolineales bacterium]